MGVAGVVAGRIIVAFDVIVVAIVFVVIVTVFVDNFY